MPSINRVQFEKPDLNELTQNNTVVDLHFHSTYSDGLNRIDKIAQRAIQLGVGIAITDHNEIRGALEIDQYENLLSIPGIELTVAEGSHLLVYFYSTAELRHFFEKEIAPHRGQGVMSSLSLTMAQAIERARDYRCVIIFPHPYCTMYTGVCNVQFSDQQRHKLFQLVDGVEVLNANNLNKWNLKCAVLGFNLDRAMVGGSDGHSINHMGRAVTYADCPKTRHDFLDAILQKANLVAGKEITLLHKMTSNGLKLRSNLGNCPDLIEKNLRYGRKVIHSKTRAIRDNVRRQIDAHLKPRRLRSYLGM
ncbi:MAG: PHP domain-containing protein [Desulfobacteraceae bacterium]|nr:MAG: PHP domain-containing protein [Desulfobacteraceae bacterium]